MSAVYKVNGSGSKPIHLYTAKYISDFMIHSILEGSLHPREKFRNLEQLAATKRDADPELAALLSRKKPFTCSSKPADILTRNNLPNRSQSFRRFLNKERARIDSRYIKEGYVYAFREDYPNLEHKGIYSAGFCRWNINLDQMLQLLANEPLHNHFIFAPQNKLEQFMWQHSLGGGENFVSGTPYFHIARNHPNFEKDSGMIYVLKVPAEQAFMNYASIVDGNEEEILIADFVMPEDIIAAISPGERSYKITEFMDIDKPLSSTQEEALSGLQQKVEYAFEHNERLITELRYLTRQLRHNPLNERFPNESFFERYEPKPEWFQMSPTGIHGIGHETRVLILAELLGRARQHKEIIEPEILRWAAITHDTQRTNDGIDSQHGERAAIWVSNNFPHLEQIDGIAYVNRWHVPDDQFAPKMTPELKVFKDADGLDRWRLGDLCTDFLRTEEAKEITEIARYLADVSMSLQFRYGFPPYQAVIKAAKMLYLVE